MIDVVDTLNTIIHLQANVINELFSLLSQYMTLEELDNLPCISKINEAAKLKNSLT